MAKIHQTLHLQHHRHTGKFLHHRHTSYRGLAVVLGVATAAIIGLNTMAKVTADSLYVYARIAAPVPTSPAVITSPSDNTTVHDANLIISGACPVITPQVIIAILDNGNTVGSAACDTSNNFSIPITLYEGANTLVARSITITDDTGPDSDPVHVTYVAPVVPPTQNPPAQPPTSIGTGTSTPLVITPGQSFVVYGPSRDATWTGSFSGGTPPYTVQIDWGDGTVNTYAVRDSSQQEFTHHYRHIAPYDITIHVTDTSGDSLTEHFAAVSPYIAPIVGGPTQKGFWEWLQGIIGGPEAIGLYGGYITILSIFALIWTHAQPPAYAHAAIGHRSMRSKRLHRKTFRSKLYIVIPFFVAKRRKKRR